ncbi:MAG: toll/interleukin-1 receptor domain-containing protein [Haliscomenobacteraceae bacterium CHB4]|nr:toll/interleukin-1 receptor domain-containing protein [Haliscomenobacteraceae bacterium CHB4]
MANAEHLAILKEGVERWNRWRWENHFVTPDLSGANLQDTSLIDANLQDANLLLAYLIGADLTNANLTNANLNGTKLNDAKMNGAKMYRADLSSANLTNADLSNADLRGAELIAADLSDAQMSGVNLGGAHLESTRMNGANLNNARLIGAYLRGAGLNHADLSGANLEGANLGITNLCDAKLIVTNLNNADLSHAKLRNADLSHAKLRNADLNHADLADANLFGAVLNDADLSKANLTGAIMSNVKIGYTIFGFTNLSTCIGLENVEAQYPCTIDFQTLRASRNLPKSFLLKIGLPELYIDYLPDFFQPEGIRLYPAFLSHSHANKPFARKLYEALIARGVNVFFDEKKMKPGDDIFTGLSRGIELYDKTILVCSEASLNSWWVDQELELVFEKERNLQKETDEKTGLLIPIRIDDHIETWSNGKRMAIKQRVIGDFRNWQDDAAFEKALDDLIHALNADRPEVKPVSHLPRKTKS